MAKAMVTATVAAAPAADGGDDVGVGHNRNPGVLRRSDTRNPRGIPQGSLGVARLRTPKRLAGVTKKREARE
jgi:hypothetical protein